MKRLVLVPHNRKSGAAKRLAQTLSERLGYKVLRVRAERVARRIPFVLREGTDKLTQMRRFQDAKVPCPEFTTERAVAEGWLRDGTAVVCRTLLRASEGRGIVVAESAEGLVPAPLYTKYVKKKKEFRVHVLNGKVIDVQEKRRRKEFEGDRDTRVRNMRNGYVFCRGGVDVPADLHSLAQRACAALGYSLGAVDVAFNERNNRLVVLEVNANPGMEGTTLQNYSGEIVNWLKENNRG
jgi:glutathione synthase/RimK-type ligase-like ATP-grasp enzyme